MKVTMDHVVLEVGDVARSLLFYREVLGFEPVREKAFLAGDVPFGSARVNAGTLIDFFPPRMWRDKEHPSNPNHLCFTMARAETEAIRARLAERGLEIIRERPENFGARGNGNSFYFADPDGIELEAKYHQSRGERAARRPR